MIKEIPERMRIAETLQMYAAIIENSDDAIYGKDLQGIITSWNKGAERIYGYSNQEAVGQQVSMLITPDMSDDVHEILSRIAKGEHIVHYETKRIRNDNQIIEVSVSMSPIRDQSGKIAGASTIARDITERKLAEESIIKLNVQLENNISQLETANKELEAFSYSVSHDLRAPLRAIDGFSKVLIEKSPNQLDEESVRYLNIVRANTQNMGKLIDDLLSFSRVGKQEMRLSLVNMERLTRETFDELKQQNPGRNIELIIKNTPQTLGDATLITIVLMNLLSNAVKFTRHKHEAVIEFGGSIGNNEIIYYVKDNGAGFNMQYLNKLFGVFQRLHSQEEFEGTGVGLALVQRIIRRHGGRVWADGKIDEGAAFYFTLPVKKEETDEQ
jgi:PAS domain S-box-containing protein